MLTSKRNKSLWDIIGGNKVFDNKKILNVKKFSKGKCHPCFTRSINLCCKQIKTCSNFQNALTKTLLYTCKSSCVIYLMECCLCENPNRLGNQNTTLELIHIEMMFGEQMVHRVTSISKCQVIQVNNKFKETLKNRLIISLKNRLIISNYQSLKFAPC